MYGTNRLREEGIGMNDKIAYIVRALIEGLVLVISIYIFSYEKADWRLKTGMGLFIGLAAYVVRLLIRYGVHTLIIVLLCTFTLTVFGKMEFYNAASSTITVFIIFCLSECMIAFLFTKYFEYSMDKLLKTITGIMISYIPLALTLGVVIVIKRLNNSNNKVILDDRVFKNNC
jgi:hypothetical protein